jgi:hypothetical protein
MTILSTEILPLTLMLFRLAGHPRRRICFDGAPSRRTVPAHGIKLDLLTKGKQAAVIIRFLRVLVGSALACARHPIIWKVKKLRERVGYMMGKGNLFLLTPARRSQSAMFWRQFIHIYVELIFGCDNFK